jgi:hypothetical protein
LIDFRIAKRPAISDFAERGREDIIASDAGAVLGQVKVDRDLTTKCLVSRDQRLC